MQLVRKNGEVVMPDFYQDGLAMVIEGDIVHINVPGYKELSMLPNQPGQTKYMVLPGFVISHYDPLLGADEQLVKEFCGEFIEPATFSGGLLPQDTVKDWLFYHGKKNDLINSA